VLEKRVRSDDAGQDRERERDGRDDGDAADARDLGRVQLPRVGAVEETGTPGALAHEIGEDDGERCRQGKRECGTKDRFGRKQIGHAVPVFCWSHPLDASGKVGVTVGVTKASPL